ncbi:MAG: alpha/beta family hydrolase [Candidatus Binataceae bacterium]
MNEKPVTFRSGDLSLEGMLAVPEKLAARAGVVCHPHPLYGGSMHNNVVGAALAAMWGLDWATLRFNFRGVGGSEGEHSGGEGEAHDATASIVYAGVAAQLKPEQIVLAGYSFGAMASALAVPANPDLAALLLIALPLRMANLDALQQFKGPILLAAGDADGYCPAPDLKVLAQRLGSRAQVRIIEGTDHFFGGYEDELAAAITEMIASI